MIRQLTLFLAIALLFGNGIAVGRTPTPDPQPPKSATAAIPVFGPSWIDNVKSIVQIVFWIVISIIASLTYLGARKTLLQPLRTEVFKSQIKEMTAIHGLFVGKGEIELRKQFGFDDAILANEFSMYDNYAFTFFDLKADSKTRPYGDGSCPRGIFTKESFVKQNPQLADGHLKRNGDESEGEDPQEKDPSVRVALWNDYHYGPIHVPKTYSDMEQQLDDLLENPLLPTKCLELLNEYKSIALGNFLLIGSVLNDVAKEMPGKYPTLDDFSNSSFDWITHRYRHQFEDLKPKADAIINFIRTHYDVDALWT